jgi:hypothetical protein
MVSKRSRESSTVSSSKRLKEEEECSEEHAIQRTCCQCETICCGICREHLTTCSSCDKEEVVCTHYHKERWIVVCDEEEKFYCDECHWKHFCLNCEQYTWNFCHMEYCEECDRNMCRSCRNDYLKKDGEDENITWCKTCIQDLMYCTHCETPCFEEYPTSFQDGWYAQCAGCKEWMCKNCAMTNTMCEGCDRRELCPRKMFWENDMPTLYNLAMKSVVQHEQSIESCPPMMRADARKFFYYDGTSFDRWYNLLS